MRAQLRVQGGKLCLRSRPGRDCTEAFPELAPLPGALRRRRLVLDGELVCLNDKGDPDFARLRARLRSGERQAYLAAKRSAATFLAFDLLHLDGRSMRELPYAERRALLAELGLDGPRWRTPRSFGTDEAHALLDATRERGLEGVVAKRLDAPYLPGVRSAAWLKHKHRRSESLLVTGWLPASGKRGETLLLARVGVDGSLAPVGGVSLGYSGQLRGRIQEALRGRAVDRCRQRGRSLRRMALRPVRQHEPSPGANRPTRL
jgi:bifunctional non-homologous end joining protein LigD